MCPGMSFFMNKFFLSNLPQPLAQHLPLLLFRNFSPFSGLMFLFFHRMLPHLLSFLLHLLTHYLNLLLYLCITPPLLLLQTLYLPLLLFLLCLSSPWKLFYPLSNNQFLNHQNQNHFLSLILWLHVPRLQVFYPIPTVSLQCLLLLFLLNLLPTNRLFNL